MKRTEDNSQKRVAFPIALFAEGASTFAEPVDMHVVPTGTWDHPMYGEMEITSADIREFVQNFNDKVRRDIPITAGHDTGMSGGELPAIGWFKELYDRGVSGLWALVEWTDAGRALLNEGAFKYFSPEFYEVYNDPETGKTYHHVLVGGALTNKPYFKELAPVSAFSEPAILNQLNENTMDINSILAKKASGEALSTEEIAFVKAATDLTDEQKTTLADELKDEAAGGDESGDGDGSEEGNGDDAGAGAGNGEGEGAGEGERQASEKNGKVITMSEAEATLLRTQADKGAQAFAELEKMKLGTSVDKMIFNEKTNTTGKFLPKQKEAVVAFMSELTQKGRDQFVNIVNTMPAINTKLFSEEGVGGEGTGDASVFAEIDGLVKTAMKEDTKLTYSDAVKKVGRANPELMARYNAGEGAGE